ncbi:MAG: bifunctional UDP-N-acetylglucosamine diphosphorylase/glucosamine-1-phosphate N-acetyltransferase GlmU [Thermodesulfovibrionales bacterium]|nr:bifunctional UDP-N-acetylglucosamine diphosphorylase/glucosamine-1-phosphate N-acetyltransferase GlmU [Thermodesulfovibrionales bacterium]
MSISVVVLAGGLGTRMRSQTPKLLHKILNKTIIERTLQTALSLNPREIIVVINPKLDAIRKALEGNDSLKFAIQKQPLGTADAFKSALPSVDNSSEWILVINGDTPLIKAQTLLEFISKAKGSSSALSILTFKTETPSDYGRIVRSGDDVIGIVEKTDITDEHSHIKEVNSGVYLLHKNTVYLIDKIPMNEKKGEYYLTDIVTVAVKSGVKVSGICIADEDELLGINSRRDLSRAISVLRKRKIEDLMDEGVTFIDPQTVYIDTDVEIGVDTTIYPNVIIENASIIGKHCMIYQGSYINQCIIEDDVVIKGFSVINQSHVKKGATIGPFAHIRPQSSIGEDSRIGNFVEVKKSNIGKGVKASHLSYIGDADIGQGTNIGAGTITCNYDGVKKHKTIIEEGVFIGSDSQLIAPVRIGKGAYVGAGSTITKDVPSNALAISRAMQRNIPEWAKRRADKQNKGENIDKE